MTNTTMQQKTHLSRTLVRCAHLAAEKLQERWKEKGLEGATVMDEGWMERKNGWRVLKESDKGMILSFVKVTVCL